MKQEPHYFRWRGQPNGRLAKRVQKLVADLGGTDFTVSEDREYADGLFASRLVREGLSGRVWMRADFLLPIDKVQAFKDAMAITKRPKSNARPLDKIARDIHGQERRATTSSVFNIGKLLIEAKESCEHGEWSPMERTLSRLCAE